MALLIAVEVSDDNLVHLLGWAPGLDRAYPPSQRRIKLALSFPFLSTFPPHLDNNIYHIFPQFIPYSSQPHYSSQLLFSSSTPSTFTHPHYLQTPLLIVASGQVHIPLSLLLLHILSSLTNTVKLNSFHFSLPLYTIIFSRLPSISLEIISPSLRLLLHLLALPLHQRRAQVLPRATRSVDSNSPISHLMPFTGTKHFTFTS
jgi:hypothetical protein